MVGLGFGGRRQRHPLHVSAFTAAAVAALLFLTAALGCMVAWSFAMLVDGNRCERHLVRAGGFIVAGVTTGVLASYL